MKKTILAVLLLLFVVLGCSSTQVSQIQKEKVAPLLELKLEQGGYNAYLRNAFDIPTKFSFKIQCENCDFGAPPPMEVQEIIIIPLEATSQEEFTLLAYDSNNNFYASAKP